MAEGEGFILIKKVVKSRVKAITYSYLEQSKYDIVYVVGPSFHGNMKQQHEQYRYIRSTHNVYVAVVYIH